MISLCGHVHILIVAFARHEWLQNWLIISADRKTIEFSQYTPHDMDQIRILTAVPVPAAVWLFGSALGMLGWMRRRGAAQV